MIILGFAFSAAGLIILATSDISRDHTATSILFLIIGIVNLVSGRHYLGVVKQHPDYGKW